MSLARPSVVFCSLSLASILLFAPSAFAKKPAAAPPPAAAPATAPVAAPAEAPPPAEPPPPKSENNASFNVVITFADGTTKAGHVKGVERTEDYSGDEGWTDDAKKLHLDVDAGSSEKSAVWTDIKTITVVPGTNYADDIDCSYSSDVTPWMYDCTLRTTSTALLKDGSKGTISTRNHWRFTFDDGSNVEFQVFKYQVREQDSKTVEFGDEATENVGLYTKLQAEIRSDVKTKIVKTIAVN